MRLVIIKSVTCSTFVLIRIGNEMLLTDHLGRLVLPLVYEILKRFLHCIDKLFVLVEACANYVVNFVLKIFIAIIKNSYYGWIIIKLKSASILKTNSPSNC